jgi:hypothetical protein
LVPNVFKISLLVTLQKNNIFFILKQIIGSNLNS